MASCPSMSSCGFLWSQPLPGPSPVCPMWTLSQALAGLELPNPDTPLWAST